VKNEKVARDESHLNCFPTFATMLTYFITHSCHFLLAVTLAIDIKHGLLHVISMKIAS